MKLFIKLQEEIRRIKKEIHARFPGCLHAEVYFGKHLSGVPNRSIIFFPYRENLLGCGLTGIVSYKNKKQAADQVSAGSLKEMFKAIEAHQFLTCKNNKMNFDNCYLGGKTLMESLLQSVRALKSGDHFYNLFINEGTRNELAEFAGRLAGIIDSETKLLKDQMGHLEFDEVDILSRRIDDLRDIHWCLTSRDRREYKKDQGSVQTC